MCLEMYGLEKDWEDEKQQDWITGEGTFVRCGEQSVVEITKIKTIHSAGLGEWWVLWAEISYAYLIKFTLENWEIAITVSFCL